MAVTDIFLAQGHFYSSCTKFNESFKKVGHLTFAASFIPQGLPPYMGFPVVTVIKEIDSVKVTFILAKIFLAKGLYFHLDMLHMTTWLLWVGMFPRDKGIRRKPPVGKVSWWIVGFIARHGLIIGKSKRYGHYSFFTGGLKELRILLLLPCVKTPFL
jgi:hypothetical protein